MHPMPASASAATANTTPLAPHRALILREMPDIAPRPLTAANAAFRTEFYRRWGTENAIVCGASTYAEFAPFRQTLSIKSARGGSEQYMVGSRRVAVDDDAWLVLNDGQIYSSLLAGSRPVYSFCVFFRPALAGEVYATLRMSPARSLDGNDAPVRQFEFAENLRPHDDVMTPALRRLEHLVADGLDDADELEEEMQQLAWALLLTHDRRLRRAASLPAMRVATRAELLRRVDRAADYLLCTYTAPFDLDRLADAAHLSKFHLARLFRAVHGVPPYAFLQRKRAVTARRLLTTTEMAAERVAEAVGFGSRATMFRQLRLQFGRGARALRARP